MIKNLLKDILDIEGVEGVVVVSNRGQIIEQSGLEIEYSRLEGIAVHILRVISSYYLSHHTVKEIEVIWDNYWLMAKNASEFVVITFCNSPKALSLIRITLNVVIAHLLEDKKFMKQIKKHASEKTVVLRKGNLEPLEVSLISKLQ